MSILAQAAAGFAGLSLALHFASHALALIGRKHAPAPRAREDWPEASLVRPLCGIEMSSCETLASSFRLSYPRHELIFCVASPDDPVIPLVEDAIARHPHVRARLLIGEAIWPCCN